MRVSARPLHALDTISSPSPARSQPGPSAVLSDPLQQLKCAGEGTRGPGGTGHILVARTRGAPPPRPSPAEARHYFGWCRPRPHLLLSPSSPGSWRGRAVSVGAAPRTRASAASAAMSGRSVPHAHPATAEYEFANPSRLGEQRFGEGLLPEEILTPTLYHGYYVRPRAAPAGEGSRAGASELRLSEGKFQAFLDVSHFTPDEVTVRTVDNLLEVSARHPQRLDRHGFVSREFCRTYVLPADVDPWRVRAALSHDGILNLEAPRGGRHLDTEVNEVYISLLPAPPDPEEEEEAARVKP
ncbi:heat shock protein beta-2 [Sapajus apella]|uniref:Heat shock protein beta-2 n=1 Tax=Sapajus apella TaxID=9515 RepID=A0A6J3IG09_SAPAP|nr:heat shock protein beta-2 [Sapajus apella]